MFSLLKSEIKSRRHHRPHLSHHQLQSQKLNLTIHTESLSSPFFTCRLCQVKSSAGDEVGSETFTHICKTGKTNTPTHNLQFYPCMHLYYSDLNYFQRLCVSVVPVVLNTFSAAQLSPLLSSEQRLEQSELQIVDNCSHLKQP